MKNYTHNDSAPYGMYIGAYDLTFVSADGETLEGKPGVNYRRVPTALALPLGALFGGAFVVVFPALVIFAVLYAAYRGSRALAARRARSLALRHINLVRHRWEPQTAYFENAANDDDGGREDDGLAELEVEVAARRKSEEEHAPASPSAMKRRSGSWAARARSRYRGSFRNF